MLEELKNMTFASEADEAAWWEANEDALADEFEKAGSEGRIGHGTAMKRASQSSITISLDPNDVVLARKQADARGVPYEDYLQALVHRALASQETDQRSAA